MLEVSYQAFLQWISFTAVECIQLALRFLLIFSWTWIKTQHNLNTGNILEKEMVSVFYKTDVMKTLAKFVEEKIAKLNWWRRFFY